MGMSINYGLVKSMEDIRMLSSAYKALGADRKTLKGFVVRTPSNINFMLLYKLERSKKENTVESDYMEKTDFKSISLNGRVAFSIVCFENTLLSLDYNINDWRIVLERLWEFTSIQYLDDWSDKIGEIIPNHLMEFKSYEEHEFEYLDKEIFEYLYNLYQTIDEKIDDLMMSIYNIGNSHAYTVIVGYGQRSLDELEKLINYMNINKIQLPDIKRFEKYSIDENRGWGNNFEGTRISSVL